jgi:hypothetical protein
MNISNHRPSKNDSYYRPLVFALLHGTLLLATCGASISSMVRFTSRCHTLYPSLDKCNSSAVKNRPSGRARPVRLLVSLVQNIVKQSTKCTMAWLAQDRSCIRESCPYNFRADLSFVSHGSILGPRKMTRGHSCCPLLSYNTNTSWSNDSISWADDSRDMPQPRSFSPTQMTNIVVVVVVRCVSDDDAAAAICGGTRSDWKLGCDTSRRVSANVAPFRPRFVVVPVGYRSLGHRKMSESPIKITDGVIGTHVWRPLPERRKLSKLNRCRSVFQVLA